MNLGKVKSPLPVGAMIPIAGQVNGLRFVTTWWNQEALPLLPWPPYDHPGKSTMPPSQKSESNFFDRLSQWEHAGRALEIFDSLMAQPLAETPANFHLRLYHSLIDHLLIALKLPHTQGASVWEWKPLYRFGQEIDPHYFTEGEIRRLLGHWPLIDPELRQTLGSVLTGFFHLRRQGFPEKYPSPFLPNAECERWIRIFPPKLAWSSLGILRQVGLLPMGSASGFRAFSRFSEGAFDPGLDPDRLRRWQAECWRGALPAPRAMNIERGEPDSVAPYRANFLAAVFAGRFEMLGIPGACSHVPSCEECPLEKECRWRNDPKEGQVGAPEVLTQARLGAFDHLRPHQLLQALFGMNEDEGARLKGLLAGTTLRQVASRQKRELRDTFGFHPLLPERMQVAFELCKRFNEERMTVGAPFATAWDVFNHFRMRMRDLKQEQFLVVLLDNKRRYLDDRIITQGTLDASPVHPREAFNAAIRESAAAVVFVHNHPSGDPKPSQDDIQVTRQLIQAGELIGIPVLDHLIIAGDGYISLLEEGLLKG